VNARTEFTIVPFVRQILEVSNIILEIFNDKLSLPAGSLLERHLMEEFSACNRRIMFVFSCFEVLPVIITASAIKIISIQQEQTSGLLASLRCKIWSVIRGISGEITKVHPGVMSAGS
jgi:hypothetical protein